jgi:hypothetical protein
MPDTSEPSHLTEWRKMLAGELYDPLDADLVAGRAWARDLCQALNATARATRTSAAAVQIYTLRRVGRGWRDHPARGARRIALGHRGRQRLTRDVPEGVFAAGNPCRVIREVE